MGRRNRKPRRRKNKDKSRTVDKPKSPDRRRFLKLGLGLAAIPTSVYVGSRLLRDDRWDFLDRTDWRVVDLDWDTVKQRYFPVGPDELLSEISLEFEEIKDSVTPFLAEEIRTRGFDLEGDYDAKPYSRIFGVPDKDEFREPALEYCKTAVEYLYNHPRISGLKKPSLDWVVINHGTNYEKKFHGRFFIGNSYYRTQRVDVVNKANENQHFEKGRSKHKCGSSLIFPERNKDGSIKSWFIYVSAVNPHVLLHAPFSEVIPLTIDPATVRYEEQAGTKNAIQAGEAISEGLSYFLVLEISNELGIPNGKRLAKESIAKLRKDEDGTYQYLPNSVAWIRKHGMQNALDLYMESPAKFMEAIGAE